MGRSVVDYMITPYADFKKFSDFEVLLINDLLLKYNIDLHPNSRIPDHSVLTCTFCYSEYDSIRNTTSTHNNNFVNSVTRKYDVTIYSEANDACDA